MPLFGQPPAIVEKSRIHQLDSEKRELIHHWCQDSTRLASEGNVFDAFMHLWMAFNAYAACVTLEVADYRMVEAFAGDHEFELRFEGLLQNAGFKKSVVNFANLWPIYKENAAYRKFMGRYNRFPYSKVELTEFCRTERISKSPPSQAISWRNVIRAIYQVRCNLFHGGKGPLNQRDLELVQSSYSILRAMFRVEDSSQAQ